MDRRTHFVSRPVVNETASAAAASSSSKPTTEKSPPPPLIPPRKASAISLRSHCLAALVIVLTLFLLIMILSSTSFLHDDEQRHGRRNQGGLSSIRSAAAGSSKKRLVAELDKKRSDLMLKTQTYWQRRKALKQIDLEELAKRANGVDGAVSAPQQGLLEGGGIVAGGGFHLPRAGREGLLRDRARVANNNDNNNIVDQQHLGAAAAAVAAAAASSPPPPSPVRNAGSYFSGLAEIDRERNSHAIGAPLVKWNASEHKHRANLSEDKFFSATPNNGRFKPECERVAGDEYLSQAWRDSKRVACQVNNSVDNPAGWARVSEFLLTHLDLRPSARLYENVLLESWTGQYQPMGCVDSHLTSEKGQPIKNLPWMAMPRKMRTKSSAKPATAAGNNNVASTTTQPTTTTTLQDKPDEKNDDRVRAGKIPNAIDFVSANNDDVIGIRYVRFHLGNIFEGIHAYVNTYLLIRALQLEQKKIQFIFEDRQENVYRDDEFWESFSLGARMPVYRYRGQDRNWRRRRKDDKLQPIFLRRLIQGPSTGISVIVSNADPLRGRGKDHHCSSSLMQNSTAWMRRNFELLGKLPKRKVLSPKLTNGKIEVVWCSRGVHPRAGGKLLLPHRNIVREPEFVLALREALGPDIKLRVVDFGRLDSAVESIRAVETAQVLIGCHGAGMTWGVFMKASDAAMIEIFGGNRASSNRHYHNIATLMDFNYRSMVLGNMYEPQLDWWHRVEGERRGLHWTGSHIRQIQNLVFGLPWDKSVRPRRPCG